MPLLPGLQIRCRPKMGQNQLIKLKFKLKSGINKSFIFSL